MLQKLTFFAMIFFALIGAGFSLPSLQSFSHITEDVKRVPDCSYQFLDDQIILDPSCLLAGQLPNFTLQEKVRIVSPFLQEWGSGYQPQKHFAVYTFESLNIPQAKKIFPLTPAFRNELQYALIKKEKIQIPFSSLAPHVAEELAFFGSEKEIWMMGPCTKQNYLLAFQQLDGKVLKAGEEFNFNHYLIKLKGYCKGQGDKKFLFYGGVCGVASQLFRAGLTSPQIEVTQRHGHNDRYAKYYGNIVQGDDAAVYETSKRFKFRNTSWADLIIKAVVRGNQTYLFFITDKKAVSNQRVEIQKDIKSPLEVQISKTIYQNQKVLEPHCQSHLGKIGKLWLFDCDKAFRSSEIAHQDFHSKYLTIEDGSF